MPKSRRRKLSAVRNPQKTSAWVFVGLAALVVAVVPLVAVAMER